MEKLELMLGETNLGNVICPVPKGNEKRIVELDKAILELGKNNYTIEQKTLEELRNKRTELSYPELELSFLAMSRKIELEGHNVKLPRFGVFPLENNVSNWQRQPNANQFSVSYISPSSISNVLAGSFSGGLTSLPIIPSVAALSSALGFSFQNLINSYPLAFIGLGLTSGVTLGGKIGYELYQRGYNFPFETRINEGLSSLPELIYKELIKSTEFFGYTEPLPPEGFNQNKQVSMYKGKKIPKKVRDKMRSIGNKTFTTELNAVIPEDTRLEIKRARQIIGDEIYVISEVKPEEWNRTDYKPISRDPLLVGIRNGKARLITCFEPTNIEKYVSREFTSD